MLGAGFVPASRGDGAGAARDEPGSSSRGWQGVQGGESFLLCQPGGCSLVPAAPAETHPDTFGELKAIPVFLAESREGPWQRMWAGEGVCGGGIHPHTEPIPAAKNQH